MRNLGIKDIDFATIHVYPSSWGIPASQYKWVNENFIGDRAALAAAAGKPLILEVRTTTSLQPKYGVKNASNPIPESRAGAVQGI